MPISIWRTLNRPPDQMTPLNRTKLPEAISIQHVAQLLDVNPMTIRRWIKARVIVAYRVGPRLIRIPRSEVARMRSITAIASAERIRLGQPYAPILPRTPYT